MKERVRELLRADFTKMSGLDLKNLHKGTEQYEPVYDAIVIAGKRQRIFLESFCSVGIDGGFCLRERGLSLAEDVKSVTDGKSDVYLDVFKPVNEWLSRGILDDGLATGGQRFRFVCSSLGENWDEIMNNNGLPKIRQADQEKV